MKILFYYLLNTIDISTVKNVIDKDYVFYKKIINCVNTFLKFKL